MPHRINKIEDLNELERWMSDAIRTPFSRQDAISPDPVRYLTPGKQLTAKERLEIYVDDYWSRCFGSLAEDFPALERIWGHEKFRSLMEEYLVAHPSRFYSLRNLGSNLEEFFKTHYEGADKELAVDIARFEWAKIEAFDNPVLPPFDPHKLTAAQKQGLDSMAFVFQPHVTPLALKYPVYELSDALRKNPKAMDRAPLPPRKECFTVVYRRDLAIYHVEIEKPFHFLLERLKNGASLSAACENAVSELSAAEIKKLEKKVTSWFQICVANKWFCAPGIKEGYRR